jgi:heme exporter protein C
MKKLALPVFAVLSAAGIAVAVWLVFMVTPLEYKFNDADRLDGSSLFFNQKIFYFHVAHAFMLFASVFASGLASIGYLVTRRARWDDLASATAEVAVVFGAVALVTGSVWGKAAWDVWWDWEPRLTMTLLLWLILVGYVIVRRFAGPSGDRIAAGMMIFGMVGVPFIYTMVGQDRHPKSGSGGVVAGLGPSFGLAFALSAVAFLCWFITLTIARVQSTRAERELRELRERALDLGVLT